MFKTDREVNMKLPKTSSGNQTATHGPDDNQGTIFLFIIGILSCVFALVGAFGANGFLPFAMITAGVMITWKLKFKTKTIPATGFNTKTLTLIAGGVILILVINFSLNVVFRVAFLQPPLTAQAISFSAKFADTPIYLYNTLFAISEEYLFRGVILYFILSYGAKIVQGFFLELVAVAGSSLAWVIFHAWVYGSDPVILAFVFFSGIVFGFLTVYSNNILAASAIHIVNNLVAAGLTVIAVTLPQILQLIGVV
jgi:membrane protease YdiL (CAAX protease family)